MSTCSGIEMGFFPANFILQSSHDHNDHEHDNHHHQQQQQQQQQQQLSSSLSSFLPTCSPHDFHGVSPMLGKRSMPFSAIDMCEERNNNNGRDDGGGVLDEDLSDDGSQVGVEKKRRLNMEQVKTLERSFEQGNKLEPERKLQLAKALGLKQRQIAIWFQNRRARWKTKQLEKDYELLKEQFDSLKADNEALLSQNQKLQSEILALKSKEPTKSINLNKGTDQGSCSNTSDDDNSSQIKLDITTTRTPTAESTIVDSYPTSIPLFHPSNSSINGPNHPHHHQTYHVVAQLFPKFDHPVKEESLTNMFCGIEDQSGLWPWLEQHNFS